MEGVLKRDTILCPLPKKRERENINELLQRVLPPPFFNFVIMLLTLYCSCVFAYSDSDD